LALLVPVFRCAACATQVYSYELLLRRLMLRAPNAALIALAAFRFSSLDAVVPATGNEVKVPNPFFNAGRAWLAPAVSQIATHSVTHAATVN
jgi:hypothetical protein